MDCKHRTFSGNQMNDNIVKTVEHTDTKMHKWEDNSKIDLALKCQYIMQILRAHISTTCIRRPLT